MFALIAQQGVQFWAQNQIVRFMVYRNVRIYMFACIYAFAVLAVVQHVVAEICGPPSLWISGKVWEDTLLLCSMLAFIQVLYLCCLSFPSCSSPFPSDKLSNKQCMLTASLTIHDSVNFFSCHNSWQARNGQMLFDISLHRVRWSKPHLLNVPHRFEIFLLDCSIRTK